MFAYNHVLIRKSEVQEYHPRLDEWRRLPDLPAECWGCIPVEMGGELNLVGLYRTGAGDLGARRRRWA